ncbi:dihydrodipicolinate synthase family protein [Paenibacillus timonensis]|uniref:dihydrodipicolinate synthase family protein n=1 Tax=Paenibacillus sp. FSL R7-0216 TaxID=2921677 RepID=UPI000F93C2D1|nr:dihydrodipicolinate synthase family protein [Paenibacillus timonensis]MUG85436.1 dihydrodipicolinate synthase family protein [Paenibacillus timonensis]
MNITEVRQALAWGLVPAVPVPRDLTGQIHEQAQEAYARYLASQSIAGAAVWAHTGRGLHMDRSERISVLETWRAALGESKLLVAGVGAIPDFRLLGAAKIDRWKQDSLSMAADAVQGGADALLVFPPVILHELPETERNQAIVDYHQALGQLGKPLILFYLYAEAGGIAYSTEVLRALLSLEMSVGIKMATLDSVMTLQDVSTLMSEEFPEQLLITGEDRMFGYSLMRGARGALVGLGAAFPNIQHDLMQAYADGDYARFMALSARVDGYAESTFIRPMDQYILRMLGCLALSGVIPEEAANDLADYRMTRQEIASLRRAIERYRLY